MAAVTPPSKVHVYTGEDQIVLEGVDWDLYQRLAETIENRAVRLAYDRGRLELMDGGLYHQCWKALLDCLIVEIAVAVSRPFWSLGSTRWDKVEASRGVEADESYYMTRAKIEAARPAWARRSNNAADYPFPDLAVEIDLRRSRVNRPAIYAALGVPEVWRFDGETLRIEGLREDGTYEPRSESAFLPIRPGEVEHWLLKEENHEQTAWARRLRAWAETELVERPRPGV